MISVTCPNCLRVVSFSWMADPVQEGYCVCDFHLATYYRQLLLTRGIRYEQILDYPDAGWLLFSLV